MTTLFSSLFMGGFECSTHRLRSGRRLDLIASTRHDRWALEDYRRLTSRGMRVARDGVRWQRVEPQPGRYDLSSLRPMVRAALEAEVQVVWDLLHFGWPDHVEPFSADFVPRFADYTRAVAELMRAEGVPQVMVCPVNEISFLCFAGGQAGFFNPFAHGRGDDLKRQLVGAAIAGSRAVRDVHPTARIVHVDPIINVVPRPDRLEDREPAEAHRRAQFHAWDMLCGRAMPELGGGPDVLDVIGVNYYVHNQWYFPGGHGSMIPPSSPLYRPLHEMLVEVQRRYGRPVFIAETGIENDERAAWLSYVGHEVRQAMRLGADLHGICLYPVVNHPGWDDDRHCHNGLWDYADDRGERAIYEPLAEELARQQALFDRMARAPDVPDDPGPFLASLDTIARSIAEATETSRDC